ncbi:MAG: hypothetical protein HQL54_02255 [Magnetococcales bacterium]|nr:hypothetical protein [Magnetococcales bacterium]
MLQVHDDQQLLPEFLAWQINQEPVQRYLQRSATGTIQRGLRRGDLESLPVSVLSLETQRVVIALQDVVQREKQLFQDLIQNRKQQMLAVVQQVLK